MTNRIFTLLMACIIGLIACYYAYNKGPISFLKSDVSNPPPGWTPTEPMKPDEVPPAKPPEKPPQSPVNPNRS